MFDDDLERTQPPLDPTLEITRGVWAVEQAARHLSRLMAARLGVSGMERLVLRVVGERAGLSFGALVQLLRLEATSVMSHLRRLRELGLVEWSGDGDPHAKIGLSARGQRYDQRAQGTVEAAVAEAARRASPETVAEVEAFLRRLEGELLLQADGLAAPARALRKRRRRHKDDGG